MAAGRRVGRESESEELELAEAGSGRRDAASVSLTRPDWPGDAVKIVVNFNGRSEEQEEANWRGACALPVQWMEEW